MTRDAIPEARGGDAVSRRTVLYGSGAVAAGFGLRLPGDTPTAGAPGGAGATRLEVHESANLCVSLSPDGATLAMDALNVIWTLPASGGAARRLTDDLQDATRPHWSPDGHTIVFQSYRHGTYDLWTVHADGSGLRRLTEGASYDREPRFSPDGRLIAFISDRGNAGRIWLLETSNGALRPLTEGDRTCSGPSWSHDGRRVFYAADGAIEAVDVSSGAVETLVQPPPGARLSSPSMSRSGRLAHVRTTGPTPRLVVSGQVVGEGEDVFDCPPVWLSESEFLYTADGGIRRRTWGAGTAEEVPFAATVTMTRPVYRRRPRDLKSRASRAVKGIADPVLSPDGRSIAFRALNALWLLPVGGRPRALADDGHFVSCPDWSPDGRTLVYSCDRAGTADLWTCDTVSGEHRRLTHLPGAQTAPRWSPDGARVAYQDEDGATWVLHVSEGTTNQVLPPLYQPGRPDWSPDGRYLVLAAVRPYSRLGSAGHNQILTVSLRDGSVRYQAVAPERSLSTRSGDGPLWTRDGRHLVFGMESLAWRVPVTADGEITGKPEQLTDEVTDSLSVSAGTGALLYLHNGVLRTLGPDDRQARTVSTHLRWRRRRPPVDRTVVRAGAVWDGRSGRLREDADVVIRDGVVEDVVRRGAVRAGTVIDASNLTVMPGLIDTHCHWYWRGAEWGDRQGRAWLAYGVTTSRSPGDPAYQMVETREALEAGVKVGPRLLGSGEGLEGTRASHRVMRPVTSPEQLDRELDRAFALEYDLVKSYMRLPVSYERHVVQRAHDRGVAVTSHYLYPAADTGLDGMEHTGGGNRLGYSRTLSAALGRTYADSVGLLAASGMWISTTTLFASELFLEDMALVDDERTRVLFPPWEYQRLREKAENADGPTYDLNHAWTVGDVDMLLRVHRAGGLVVAGTDAALDDIGIALHQNLRAMVKYGFTPYEALTTATGNAARALGLHQQIGALAPGYLADLVCVEGDPLTDVKSAAAVRRVMVGGRAWTVPELLEPFQRAGAVRDDVPVHRPGPRQAPSTEHYWHRPEWRQRGCCRPM